MAFENKALTVGSKVFVAQPMNPPEGVTWDDDAGRTSGQLKKRLIESFFKQDKRITAEVVYIGKESEREALRRKGLIKIRVKDQAGCILTLTADPNTLTPCH